MQGKRDVSVGRVDLEVAKISKAGTCRENPCKLDISVATIMSLGHPIWISVSPSGQTLLFNLDNGLTQDIPQKEDIFF